MIRYLEPLYTTTKTEKLVKKIRRAFSSGAGMTGIYLITIASNEKDVFDVFSVMLLKQRGFRHRDYDVIGIAESEEAAFSLVARIHDDYFRAFGSYDGIRQELLRRLHEQEKET
ncbi:MAG: hypothetical protein J6Y57_08335 [Lachnospiraceae bacterium]|nr:hypothetical protein [Lachnospiraceae bacterium]